MALKKDKVLKNGIVLTYHRVVSVNSITNMNSTIEVGSYLNKDEREKEREWYASSPKERLNVYISTTYYPTAYDKNLNVDSAYEYLKTLEDFADAEDVLEETPAEETDVEEETTPEETTEIEENIEETEMVEEENK